MLPDLEPRVSGREQVAKHLVVQLHIRRRHLEGGARWCRVHALEELDCEAGHNTQLCRGAHDAVALAAARLPIRKDRAVVALKCVVEDLAAKVIVHLLLRCLWAITVVEGKLRRLAFDAGSRDGHLIACAAHHGSLRVEAAAHADSDFDVDASASIGTGADRTPLC